MFTQLDTDPRDLLPDAREFVGMVRKFGWAVTHVYGDKSGPSFTYTTGFWVNYGAPEIILFGLEQDIAHCILITIANKLKAGERFTRSAPDGRVLEGYNVYFFPADPDRYADYLLRSIWFYDNEAVPCYQLVWPDQAGCFPWQEEFTPRLLGDQRDMTKDGWQNSLLH